VNAAAERLHTSQPAVSRELRNLEERIGSPLFDRLPRGMRLTEAGRVLLDYAERIFGLERAAEHAIRELTDLEGGQLTIGASNTLGTYLLPAFVAAFHTRHPKVNLSLEIGNTQEIVKGLLESRFVLGFVEGRIMNDAIEARELRRDRIVAVVAPSHPLATAKAISVRSLATSPAILREPGSGTREIVERAFARNRVGLRCGLQISSSEAIKRAAMAGDVYRRIDSAALRPVGTAFPFSSGICSRAAPSTAPHAPCIAFCRKSNNACAAQHPRASHPSRRVSPAGAASCAALEGRSRTSARGCTDQIRR
jgi:DNA-binding transcriptional LysR family regulator